jgi:hypothetical protein
MREYGVKALAILLLTLCSAALARDGWDGRYAWQASYGQTAGGSTMVQDYRLTITGKLCSIAVDGYQTQDKLLCTVAGSADKITLRFASYESGAPTNAYGVQIYRVGQPLIALERLDSTTVKTTGLGLSGLDGKLARPGIQFHKE